MPERIEQQNRIVACAGRKGSGKSTKAREILTAMALADPEHVRMFVYDTMGEHRWIPETIEDQDKAVMYLMESTQWPNFMARYVPDADDEENDFNNICEEVYNAGNLTFVIEEVVMLGCSPGYAPPKFKRIMRLGRHMNIDVFYTTQRLGECPRALTAATDVFILFAHSEPRDIDRISERCGAEVAKQVEKFRDHEFLVYDVNQKKVVSTVDCGAMIIPVTSPRSSQPTIEV